MEIIVPKRHAGLPAWMERELRTGGRLRRSLDRERARTDSRMAIAAEHYRDAVPHRRGSEFSLKAVLDSRTWMRWFLTDPHFWDDPVNVNRFVKDNPLSTPWKR